MKATAGVNKKKSENDVSQDALKGAPGGAIGKLGALFDCHEKGNGSRRQRQTAHHATHEGSEMARDDHNHP